MTIIVIALLLAVMSAMSGILAIGSGRHWHFKVWDYFRGKRNAILYLYVTGTTAFSFIHATVIATYGLTYHWTLRSQLSGIWMTLHAAMGIILILAHCFIASTLAKEVGPIDKFLWGKRRD